MQIDANTGHLLLLARSGGVLTERVRIESGGNVGIGTIGPEVKLHVNSSADGVVLRTQDSSNFKCDMNPGSAADWSCASDERKKKNIIELEPSLNKILNLKPRRFDTIYGEKNLTGFIAQEVQEVFPDTVDDSDPDDLSLAQGEFMPYLVKAMQEQQSEIKSLKYENEELKQRLVILEAKLK